MTDERIEPPLTGGEPETLRGYLDRHRAALAMTCAGLSDEGLRRRSLPPSTLPPSTLPPSTLPPSTLPPSTLSLQGLVRHMAEVERSWFRRVIAGEDVPFDAWDEEIARARRIEEAAPSLDVTGLDRREGNAYSLRLVMLHLIQEHARHNGHADLICEGIDGTAGV